MHNCCSNHTALPDCGAQAQPRRGDASSRAAVAWDRGWATRIVCLPAASTYDSVSYYGRVAPPKRRSGGRTTPKKSAGAVSSRIPDVWDPAGVRRSTTGSSARVARARSPVRQPAASSRYTPPSKPVRVRPRWHRLAGWIGVAVGILIAVLNDTMLVISATLLPVGHSEGWLLLGLSVAAASTWFLGVFDRGKTIFR